MESTQFKTKRSNRILLTTDEIRQLPALARVTVTEEYIDRLGHMNVEWYFRTFGLGAMKMMAKIGITSDYIEKRHGGSFVLTQTIRYIAEARLGDDLSVHGRVLGRSGKKFHHMYFMVNDSQDNLAATMESLNIHADLKARGSSPYPPEIAENIDRIWEEHRQLAWAAPLSGAIRI